MALSSTGKSAFASVIKAGRWPELPPATLDHIADLHEDWSKQLTHAADLSESRYQPEFSELLQGQAGDALQTSLGENVHRWLSDAAAHHSASTAVRHAADYLRGLRTDLTAIITVGEPQYDAALHQGHASLAESILAEAESQAEAAAQHAASRISSALNRAFGAAPASTDHGAAQQGSAVLTSAETVGAQARPQQGGGGASGGERKSAAGQGNSTGAGSSATSTDGLGQAALLNSLFGQQNGGQATPTQSSVVGAMPTSVASDGATPVSDALSAGSASTPASSAGAGAGSGALSSATSSAPAGAGSSAGAATAPAGDISGVSQGAAGAGSDAGGPGLGAASSMVTSGAVPSAVQPVQLSDQASSAASALAPLPAMSAPATADVASSVAPAAPASAVTGPDGGGGAASAGAGANGMMSAPSTPGPLTPYSPPGEVPPPSPQSMSASAAPVGPNPAVPAASGVDALITGSGPRGRLAPVPTTSVNPDMVWAQRVLAGLVKACPTRPIFWAVSVLRTPTGPETVIASSVGGGAYLPPEISVPSTMRLAVLDPALPAGWAAAWMGWQSPLTVLADHYERFAEVVKGVTVSAMTTSEIRPARPDCGGDFAPVRHEELVVSTAVPLAGGHRMIASDPALATRLTALDRGGDVTAFVAAQLTRAVWSVAAQPDDTGLPLAVKEDADILARVAEGAARREHWDDYRHEVERRAEGAVMMPEFYAPRDADDSPGSLTARMWYRHYYARGCIAEMVRCWASQPVSLLDIAYCGVAAGFGTVIAAVVTELEALLPELVESIGTAR